MGNHKNNVSLFRANQEYDRHPSGLFKGKNIADSLTVQIHDRRIAAVKIAGIDRAEGQHHIDSIRITGGRAIDMSSMQKPA